MHRVTVTLTRALLLLGLLVAGCGEPVIETAPDALSTGDGDTTTTGGDTTATDASPSDTEDWHDGGKATLTFTGQGQIEVTSDKTATDMRGLKLLMFQTAKPEPGKVYVWWMRSPLGKSANFGTLPYEDVPYVPDFSVEVGDPGDGSPPHIQNFNAAYVTYEDEAGADELSQPVGPLVWKGEIPKPGWAHVQHVLTEWQGDKGYIVQAAIIMAQVKKELDLARAAVKNQKPAVARRHVENIHTLIVGKDDAKDLDGDKKVVTDLVPYTMGLAAGDTPLNNALKHAKFAEASAKDSGGVTTGLETGVIVMETAVKGFNDNLLKVIDAVDTFATNTSKDFQTVDKTVTQLNNKFGEAFQGAQKLGQIDLKL